MMLKKLLFINIFRTLRYTLPLFLIFTLTSGAAWVADTQRNAGQALREQIMDSYQVTVDVVYVHPVLLSGKIISDGEPFLTMSDIRSAQSSEFVRKISYYTEANSSPFVWELGFDPSILDLHDVTISGKAYMDYLRVYGVENAAALSILTLQDGRYLDEQDDGNNHMMITEKLAALYDLHCGDTVMIPTDMVFKKPLEIVGIVSCSTSPYALMMPISSLLKAEQNVFGGAVNGDERQIDDVHFILYRPDTAADFIAAENEIFSSKDFILQADDAEYKRAVYPIELMMDLNLTMYIIVLCTGAVLLSVLSVKSAHARLRDIAVLRLLSCESKKILWISLLEKILVMGGGMLTGLLLGVLVQAALGIQAKPGTGLLWFLCGIYGLNVLMCAVIFDRARRKKPMEVLHAYQ